MRVRKHIRLTMAVVAAAAVLGGTGSARAVPVSCEETLDGVRATCTVGTARAGAQAGWLGASNVLHPTCHTDGAGVCWYGICLYGGIAVIALPRSDAAVKGNGVLAVALGNGAFVPYDRPWQPTVYFSGLPPWSTALCG